MNPVTGSLLIKIMYNSMNSTDLAIYMHSFTISMKGKLIVNSYVAGIFDLIDQ